MIQGLLGFMVLGSNMHLSMSARLRLKGSGLVMFTGIMEEKMEITIVYSSLKFRV